MTLSIIRNALNSIRADLVTLSESTEIVYDAAPMVDVTKKIVDLIEKNGIPDVMVHETHRTEEVTSKYFNDFTISLHRTLLTISRTIDELIETANVIMTRYNDKMNEIMPLMDTLIQRIDDIEDQTLEKVTNKSILDHEIKNIDFRRTVSSNDLTVVNNTLLLPITEQVAIVPDDQRLAIIESAMAQQKLGGSFNSESNKTDQQVIQGTYLGNIIGMLDGSEEFHSEDNFDVLSLYNTDINDILNINYHTANRNDRITMQVENIYNTLDAKTINFISIDSNVIPKVAITKNAIKTNIEMKNGIWPFIMEANTVTMEMRQDKPTKLNYQGIDIIDKNTGTRVKRHNYFNSLNYLFPETLKSLNPDIKVSKIKPTPQQEVKIVKRDGFFKYHLEIGNISLFLNHYSSNGTWESDIISTVYPIESVEIETDQAVPDGQMDYVSYEISFDRITWHPIRPTTEGVNDYNKDKKTRIVLNNDNTNTEYLYIGTPSFNMGVYMRVVMNSNDILKTPVVYNAKLRIKVDRG